MEDLVLWVPPGQDIPQVLIDRERSAARRAFMLGAQADGLGQGRARALAYACFPSTVASSCRSTWAGKRPAA